MAFFSAAVALVLSSQATFAAGSTMAGPAMPASVTARLTPAGTFFTTAAGMTLYTFDDDIGGHGSTCGGDCAKNFPPLLASADDKPAGAWTVTVRSNGDKQWALGRHAGLYLFR